MATLARIGWTCINAFLWQTHRGQINVLEVAPRAVARLAHEALERWQWREVARSDAGLANIGPTAVLEPVCKLLQSRTLTGGWTALQQGNLKSLVVNGQWPQLRLFLAGLSETAECQLCGATGTLRHRLYDCPALLIARQQYGHDELLACAHAWPDLQLWTRCLMSDPSWHYPPPRLDELVVWEKAPAGGVLDGESYGDGSGRRPRFARLRRCGWGLVCYTRGVGVTARAHGPLPGWQQDVPLAESYAFLITLRFASVRVCFYTDCEFVRNTFEAGPAHSTSGWFIYAGVWRQIWKYVEDIGVENVQVRWIPAHTTAKAVAEGRITGLQRICNAQADEHAKKGADMHPHNESVAELTERTHRTVHQVARYVGTINSMLGRRTLRDSTAEKAAGRNAGDQRTRRSRPVSSRHMAELIGNRLRCTLCFRSAVTRSVLAQLPCRDVGRASAHSLRIAAGIVFCTVCGCYSASKARGLLQSCARRAEGSRATALRRLMRNEHPKTGKPLEDESSARVRRHQGRSVRHGLAHFRPPETTPRAAPSAGQTCGLGGACQCPTCQVLEQLGRRSRPKMEAMPEDSDENWSFS